MGHFGEQHREPGRWGDTQASRNLCRGICIYVYAYVHVYVHVYVYVYVYVCVCMYVCLHVCKFVVLYTNVHMLYIDVTAFFCSEPGTQRAKEHPATEVLPWDLHRCAAF